MAGEPAIRDALLVCGGKYHDIDFARLEILKVASALPHHRLRVVADYSDMGALTHCDYLVTYTCEVHPDATQSAAIDTFLTNGGRWFALHGTNSALAYQKGAGWHATDAAPHFMNLLGSQFAAHPPIASYTVNVTDDHHPLTRGIDAFEVTDELYLCRFTDEDIEVLLHASFKGQTPGFVDHDWSDANRRPVMYLRNHGAGQVLNLLLGHARGHFDMRPLMDHYDHVERGSWESPVFMELLDRGLRWAARELAS